MENHYKKLFNDKLLASFYMLLIFYLSLSGIYQGEINNSFIKNELPFLYNNYNLINASLNLAKQI